MYIYTGYILHMKSAQREDKQQRLTQAYLYLISQRLAPNATKQPFKKQISFLQLMTELFAIEL